MTTVTRDPGAPPAPARQRLTTIEELDADSDKIFKKDDHGNILSAGFMPAEPGWWNWAWIFWKLDSPLRRRGIRKPWTRSAVNFHGPT